MHSNVRVDRGERLKTRLPIHGIELSPEEPKAILWLFEVEPEEYVQVPEDMPARIGEGH